jgi:predicted DNA-binding protein
MNNVTKTLSSKSESAISSAHNNKQDDFITITQKIKLKKDQYEVLKIICDTYQTPFSEYLQEAIIEAMRFDIEEGNFSNALLEKIDSDDKSKNSSPSSFAAPLAPDLMNSDLDLLKKLQT